VSMVTCTKGTNGCYASSSNACDTGFTCQYNGSNPYCGCPNTSACAGNSFGTVCLNGGGYNECGCNTSNDCPNGYCCYTAQTSHGCYTGMVGGLTCQPDGGWGQ
jgi:hypothetical protein